MLSTPKMPDAGPVPEHLRPLIREALVARGAEAPNNNNDVRYRCFQHTDDGLSASWSWTWGAFHCSTCNAHGGYLDFCRNTGISIGAAKHPPGDDRIEGVFRALLGWNLRVSFGPPTGSPGQRVYTVAEEPDDGERVDLMVDVDVGELAAWVTARQTRELLHQLPPAGVALLVGAPMAGKTSTALHLAREAVKAGPVIFAALEDREAVLRERIRDELGPEDADELWDMTILPELPRIGADPGVFDVLERHLVEMRPALLVVDSLAFIMDKTDQTSQKEALDQLQILALKHGARFVVVHHIKLSDKAASLSAVVSATLNQHAGHTPMITTGPDDLGVGFKILGKALQVPGDIPLYTLIDGKGQPVLEGATAEDLRRWTNPPPDGTWSADQRIKAAMTRLAGLYLDLATLRGEVSALDDLTTTKD